MDNKEKKSVSLSLSGNGKTLPQVQKETQNKNFGQLLTLDLNIRQERKQGSAVSGLISLKRRNP